MKLGNTPSIPDTATLASEATLDDRWDAAVISQLIRSKSSHGETPAFLFLGRKEAALLRRHLQRAFGAEAVASPSFVFAGGRKSARILQDPIARRPAWRDREESSLWRFRL